MDYSILMSVYYKEKPEYLKQAIESMLNQTIKSNDFVIVCDGPLTKELYEVLEKYKSNPSNCIRLLELDKNYGLGIALNKGLKVCKNELVARMDSDDIAVADRIEKQIYEFKLNPNLILCGSNVEEFDQKIADINIIKKVPETNEEIRKYVKKRNPFNHMTVVFKKSAIEAVGSYEHCYLSEDYYLWAKVIAANNYVINIPESLVYMRVGNGMYERRGGIRYIKGDISIQVKLKRLNLISLVDLIINIFIRILIRLFPTALRKKIYIKLLRRSSKNE